MRQPNVKGPSPMYHVKDGFQTMQPNPCSIRVVCLQLLIPHRGRWGVNRQLVVNYAFPKCLLPTNC